MNSSTSKKLFGIAQSENVECQLFADVPDFLETRPHTTTYRGGTCMRKKGKSKLLPANMESEDQ